MYDHPPEYDGPANQEEANALTAESEREWQAFQSDGTTEDDLYNQISELLTTIFPRIGATDDAMTEFITGAIAKVELFHGIYRLSDREVIAQEKGA